MEGTARIWFRPQQRAELWERWKNGQCVANIARARRQSFGRNACSQARRSASTAQGAAAEITPDLPTDS
jgi:hypothetical protein